MLLLPLRVNTGGERIFESQGNKVHRQHLSGQQNPRGLPKPKRRSQEAHRRSVIHRGTRDIEREPRNHTVHQDAKVVTQVCARDTESPHGREDEHIAASEEPACDDLCEPRLEKRMRGLASQRLFIEKVAEDAKGEDRYC